MHGTKSYFNCRNTNGLRVREEDARERVSECFLEFLSHYQCPDDASVDDYYLIDGVMVDGKGFPEVDSYSTDLTHEEDRTMMTMTDAKCKDNMTAVTGLCPEAFERHGDYCYQAVGLLASWAEAKRMCNTFGADLAVIETPTDEIIIEGILKRYHGSIHPENYWIDGSDILKEGEWRWMREEGRSRPIGSYTAWSPGQPDNAGSNEHCLEIRYSFGVHWNDYECNYKQNFICQVLAEPNGGAIIG